MRILCFGLSVAALVGFSCHPLVTHATADAAARQYAYRVVNTYPHDPGAFTQGLIFSGGALFESTGHYGESSLRRVELETGKFLGIRKLSGDHFAEGLALMDGHLFQLTWQEGLAFRCDPNTLAEEQRFRVTTEGWGLTHDGTHLILSDGSSTLFRLDSATFRVVSTLQVRDGDQPVNRLNELEWVDGRIYANVWMTDRIAIIDPATGQVTGWIHLEGLLSHPNAEADVLNGIAYDPAKKRLFVTGKCWDRLFEIELVPR